MNQIRDVGFLGCGCGDFCIFLAEALKALGKNTLIIDCSKDSEILLSTVRPKENLPRYTYKGVDYTTRENLLLAKETESCYDYVFKYFGGRVKRDDLCGLQEIFTLSGTDRFRIENLRRLMVEMALPMNVVLRGNFQDKKYFRPVFAVLEYGNAFIAERFVVPYDESDAEYKFLMEYGGLKTYKDLSKGYEKVLFRSLEIISKEDVNSIKNAIKKAKRGIWI